MLKQVIDIINNSQNILILPHINQDGDALGSCFALRLVLKSLGKESYVMLDGPHNYCRILYGFDDNTELESYDLAIAVDCGDKGRLGDRESCFDACPETCVIDHHGTNEGFGRVNYVVPSAAATGELIYELANEMHVDITPRIATNLHLAIAADTGGLMFANTTPKTLRIEADLIEKGAEYAKINTLLFSTNSYSKLSLMKKALDSLQVFADGQISCIYISRKDMQESGASPEECDGLVALPRSLEGVRAALFIKEKQDGTMKVSMRSDGSIDVSRICAANGGGGHKMAAGCNIEAPFEETLKLVLKQVQEKL